MHAVTVKFRDWVFFHVMCQCWWYSSVFIDLCALFSEGMSSVLPTVTAMLKPQGAPSLAAVDFPSTVSVNRPYVSTDVPKSEEKVYTETLPRVHINWYFVVFYRLRSANAGD